jgi:hypothetical protein
MNKRALWSRILSIVGLAMTAVGLVAFLGVFFVINSDRLIPVYLILAIIGTGLASLGAFLAKSGHRTLLYVALGLTVGNLIAFLLGEGSGVTEDDLLWVFLVLYAYPIGPIMSLVGDVLVLFESPRASMPALGGVPTSRRRWWSRTVSVVGLAVTPVVILIFVGSLIMQLGGLDFPIIFYIFLLAVSGLPALGAFLGKSRHRTFLYVALVPTVCGTIAALLFGFYQDQFIWRILFVLAYLLGLIMSCVGAVLVVFESLRRPPVPKENVGTA